MMKNFRLVQKDDYGLRDDVILLFKDLLGVYPGESLFSNHTSS